MPAQRRIPALLVAGDLVTLAFLAVAGFLTHNEAITWRWLAILLPSCLSWALIAPWLGNYSPSTASRPSHFWRGALAGFLAAPITAWLRGLILGSAILPVFVLVLSLTTAAGMGLWRLIWGFIASRTSPWTKTA